MKTAMFAAGCEARLRSNMPCGHWNDSRSGSLHPCRADEVRCCSSKIRVATSPATYLDLDECGLCRHSCNARRLSHTYADATSEFRTAAHPDRVLRLTSPWRPQSQHQAFYTLSELPSPHNSFRYNGCRHALDDHRPLCVPPGPHRCAPAGVARSLLADRPLRAPPSYPPT